MHFSVPLLLKSKISSFKPSFVAAQAEFSLSWLETPKTSFLVFIVSGMKVVVDECHYLLLSYYNPLRPKKIIPLFLRPLFEETDAGGRFFILIFI